MKIQADTQARGAPSEDEGRDKVSVDACLGIPKASGQMLEFKKDARNRYQPLSLEQKPCRQCLLPQLKNSSNHLLFFTFFLSIEKRIFLLKVEFSHNIS